MTDALAVGARGGGIVILGQAGKLLIQLIALATLSRLLSPSDFGLIAMVGVFTALGETIRDFGMTTIGLQRNELSHHQASNLFWLNTSLGLVAGFMLAISTPLVAKAYGDDRLWQVVPLLALTLPINGMSAQLGVQLSRAMRYRASVGTDLATQALALTIAVGSALAGAGYWALVLHALATATLGLLLRWITTRWLPAWPQRGAGVKRDVRDGMGFGLSALLQYLTSNIDTYLIGVRWGSSPVGLYDRAFRLLKLPASSILGPLTQVVIPTVNRALAEGGKADPVLLRAQGVVGFIIIWVFAVTAAVADWLIPFVLGPEWSDAIPLFQVLAIGGAVQVFSNVSYWRFIVSNLGKQLFYCNVLTKLLSIVLIALGALVSLKAVAWMVSLGLVLSWPINLIWLARTAGQDSWAYFRGGTGLLGAGALAFAVGWAIATYAVVFSEAAAAIAGATVSTAVYVGVVATTRSGRHHMVADFAYFRHAFGR